MEFSKFNSLNELFILFKKVKIFILYCLNQNAQLNNKVEHLKYYFFKSYFYINITCKSLSLFLPFNISFIDQTLRYSFLL